VLSYVDADAVLALTADHAMHCIAGARKPSSGTLGRSSDLLDPNVLGDQLDIFSSSATPVISDSLSGGLSSSPPLPIKHIKDDRKQLQAPAVSADFSGWDLSLGGASSTASVSSSPTVPPRDKPVPRAGSHRSVASKDSLSMLDDPSRPAPTAIDALLANMEAPSSDPAEVVQRVSALVAALPDISFMLNPSPVLAKQRPSSPGIPSL